MKIVLFPSDSANSAEIAVKLASVTVVVQSTNRAKVKAKFDSTFAAVGHDILQLATLIALDLLNILPFQFVGFLGSIVTKAT